MCSYGSTSNCNSCSATTTKKSNIFCFLFFSGFNYPDKFSFFLSTIYFCIDGIIKNEPGYKYSMFGVSCVYTFKILY